MWWLYTNVFAVGVLLILKRLFNMFSFLNLMIIQMFYWPTLHSAESWISMGDKALLLINFYYDVNHWKNLTPCELSYIQLFSYTITRVCVISKQQIIVYLHSVHHFKRLSIATDNMFKWPGLVNDLNKRVRGDRQVMRTAFHLV